MTASLVGSVGGRALNGVRGRLWCIDFAKPLAVVAGVVADQYAISGILTMPFCVDALDVAGGNALMRFQLPIARRQVPPFVHTVFYLMVIAHGIHSLERVVLSVPAR